MNLHRNLARLAVVGSLVLGISCGKSGDVAGGGTEKQPAPAPTPAEPKVPKPAPVVYQPTPAPADGKPAEGTPAEGKPAEGTPADGKPAEGTPAEPPAAACAPDIALAPGRCDEWTARVCKEAGEQSGTCKSVKTSAGLMPEKACHAALAEIDVAVKRIAEMGKSCTQLVEKLCADLGPDTKTCGMVKERTPSFGADQCTQMLESYDRVIGELRQMEAQNKPMSAELKAKLLAGNPPSFGPEDAKVTMVEFSDFECPYCSMAAKTAKQVKEKYGSQVRFVFRQFPLSFHKNADGAAQASLEAHAQGKFWELHDILFENQKTLERSDLERLSGEAGLDVEKLKAALDAGTHAEAVKADMQLGTEAAVQGTPSLFLNGERVDNPNDFEALAKLIDEALAK